jgi:antitoxin VapB
MAINIKNRKVEELIKEIRAETGEGVTATVLAALNREAETIRRRKHRQKAETRKKVMAIVKRARAKAINTHLTPEEIIGYDEYGLPE